jgi:hypothetical protein
MSHLCHKSCIFRQLRHYVPKPGENDGQRDSEDGLIDRRRDRI